MSGRALVVVAHGHPYAVCWDGDDGLSLFVGDCGGSRDGIDFEKAGVDHAKLEDGVWIGELRTVDNGPGDYPGTRECVLQFRNERRATAAEWKSHCSGEWPWEPRKSA